MADLCLVTKADGALRQPASEAASHLRSALKVLTPGTALWSPSVMEVALPGVPTLTVALTVALIASPLPHTGLRSAARLRSLIE